MGIDPATGLLASWLLAAFQPSLPYLGAHGYCVLLCTWFETPAIMFFSYSISTILCLVLW